MTVKCYDVIKAEPVAQALPSVFSGTSKQRKRL